MKLLQARVQIIRIGEKAWGRQLGVGGAGEKAKKQNDSRKLGINAVAWKCKQGLRV
jgi:hypothetical protein